MITRKESKKEGRRLLVAARAMPLPLLLQNEAGTEGNEERERGEAGKLPQTSVCRGRRGEVAINKYTELAKRARETERVAE